MAFFDKFRKQTAVVWKQDASSGYADEYGKHAFNAGAEITVRWDDEQREVIDGEGATIVSRAIVMVDDADGVKPGDYLFLGVLTDLDSGAAADPNIQAEAFPVLVLLGTPTLKADATLREAVL